MDIYHQHSGRIGPLGFPALAVVGLVGSVLVGMTFALGDHFLGSVLTLNEDRSGFGKLLNILVLFKALLPFLLAIGFGWVLGRTGEITKVRNLRAMIAAATLSAGVTMWVYWSVRVGLFPAADTGYVHGVVAILAHMQTIAVDENPMWTQTWWACQALIVLLGIASAAYARIDELAFDETIGEWVREKIHIEPLEPIPNPEWFKERMESGDFEPLLSLRKISRRTAPTFTSLELISSAKNPDFNLVTVKSITKRESKNGDGNEVPSIILHKLRSTAELNTFLREIMRQSAS